MQSGKYKRKVIKTPELKIDENIMKYGNAVIQMNSVTRCEVASMPSIEYPVWAILGLLLGVMLLILHFMLWGCVILAICGVTLFLGYDKNKELGEYLILELNSGNTYLFFCTNHIFLLNALEAIIDCFNNKETSYIINFQSCKIENSQFGDRNKMENK